VDELPAGDSHDGDPPRLELRVAQAVALEAPAMRVPAVELEVEARVGQN
jgi:hypothetical protein